MVFTTSAHAEAGGVEDRRQVAQRALGLRPRRRPRRGRRSPGRGRAGRCRTAGRRWRWPGCTGRWRPGRRSWRWPGGSWLPPGLLGGVAGAPGRRRSWTGSGSPRRTARAGPGRAGRRRPGPRGRRRRPRPPRHAKDRAPSGSGRSRDADRAAEEPQQRPLERHEAGLHDGGGRARGRWPRPARTPGRGGRPRGSVPRRSSSARCCEARRAAPPAARAPASQARNAAGVEMPQDGVTSSRPGRSCAGPASRSQGSGERRSPRPSTSAGPPARKNGTSEPSSAASRWRALGDPASRPRPRARRRRPRRRPTSRRRGPRRPGCASRGGRRAAGAARGVPTPAARRDGPRRWPAGRGCPRAAPGRTPSTWRVSVAARRRDRDREAVREVDRDHDAVEVVEPVGAGAEDRERQVDLGRREPDDGLEAARRDRCIATLSVGLGDVAEGLGEGEPLPHRDGLGPAVARRCRTRRGRPPRARAGAAAGGRGRCGASCGARGSPAWTRRHRCSSASASRRSSVVVRLEDEDRGLHLGRGLEGVPRDPERDPGPGVVLEEDREVAHLAGRRRDPLGDLALDHQHQPPGPRRLAQEPVQDRARDVVREVGDDVVGLGHEVDEVLVERVALDDAAARRGLELRRRTSRAGRRRGPRSSSTAVTLARRRRGARPSGTRGPGRSRGRRGPAPGPPRAGSPRGRRRRRGSSARGCGAPAGPRRAGAAGRSAGRAAGRSRAVAVAHRAPAGSDGPRVEVEARALAGGEAPGARRPRSSRRCPCTGRAAGRPSRSRAPPPRRRAGRAARAFAATPPPSTMPARPDLLGRPDRLGREDVDDRVLEAPGELGDRPRRGAARPRARPRAGRPRRARVRDDPPGGGLEAGEAEVVRVAQPGPREDAVVRDGAARPPARSPARPDSRGRAAGPTLSNASPAASSTVVPEQPVRRGGPRISTRNVCPPDTTSATSGNGGASRSASPGSSSQPA